MEIIGLLGHQGVGKNYIAEKILPSVLQDKRTIVLAFADHFKIDCINKHNLEYDKVFGNKDFETRKKLQIVGTEEGRDVYGQDIWIKILESWIKVHNSRGIKRFIISDVRYQNEVDWIKSLNGIVIKIDAPNRFMARLVSETNNDIEKMNKIKFHQSEKMIDEIMNYDNIVNNDFGSDIKIQIKECACLDNFLVKE
jgi:phosphomevalonate kinase